MHRVDNLELIANAEVSQLPSERHLIVAESTVLALEGRNDNLLEEGDLCEEEPGRAILLAVHA